MGKMKKIVAIVLGATMLFSSALAVQAKEGCSHNWVKVSSYDGSFCSSCGHFKYVFKCSKCGEYDIGCVYCH